jgi:hypothetical protein
LSTPSGSYATPELPAGAPPGDRFLAWRLFALSFTALFLELMLIRWVPSTVRLVAYYANLMLLSSFLGLGVGALLARRRWRAFGWFPVLLAIDVGFLRLSSHEVMPGSAGEYRFYGPESMGSAVLILAAIFCLNALLFVPLGQEIGALFHRLRTLRAYAWDLTGSLCGTLCLGMFSYLYFSPAIGMAVVVIVYLALVPWRRWLWTVPLFTLVLLAVMRPGDHATLWSPYYCITIKDAGVRLDQLSQMRSRLDPPIYTVNVNRDFYQRHGTLDARRYTPGQPLAKTVAALREQYLLPYSLAPSHKRVAVMGAGGGMDVEGALLSGSEHVDAVEIDPVLVDLSRCLSSSAVYDDARVTVHVNDARAFLRSATPGYDMVVFGHLDSQALFSHMASIRLDGFTYTVESMRTAYGLLNDDGVLVISFAVGPEWLARKVVEMVREGTGKEPITYMDIPEETGKESTTYPVVPKERGREPTRFMRGGHVVVCASKGQLENVRERIGGFVRVRLAGNSAGEHGFDAPTDDWPYLYLRTKGVPRDYLVVIAVLLGLSALVLLPLRGLRWKASDGHFFFLGMGFLLLETKSISDCSLYFGATWVVTTLVVAGVLLMVLGANWMAMGLKRFSLSLYAPLFAVLATLYLVPHDWVLSLPLAARLAWVLLAVPFPIFFAGLIFSTTFRDVGDPSGLLGTNLLGAMAGGFCEYLGMAVGNQNLTLIVILAYAASLVCQIRGRGTP